MIRCPQTKDQAVAYRYNRWAGNPSGWRYNPDRCAYEVYDSGRGGLSYQCQRKPGKGPDGLYCGQHAKSLAAQGEQHDH